MLGDGAAWPARPGPVPLPAAGASHRLLRLVGAGSRPAAGRAGLVCETSVTRGSKARAARRRPALGEAELGVVLQRHTHDEPGRGHLKAPAEAVPWSAGP